MSKSASKPPKPRRRPARPAPPPDGHSVTPTPGGGWFARCHFDGTHGVPKHTLYLGLDGNWHDAPGRAALFPSEELCRAFLDLRRRFECVAGALDFVESGLKFRRDWDSRDEAKVVPTLPPEPAPGRRPGGNS
jgi:hypothetical protein